MVPTHSSNPIMYGSVENVNTQRLLAWNSHYGCSNANPTGVKF
jgi:hypothetical protein